MRKQPRFGSRAIAVLFTVISVLNMTGRAAACPEKLAERVKRDKSANEIEILGLAAVRHSVARGTIQIYDTAGSLYTASVNMGLIRNLFIAVILPQRATVVVL